MRIVVAGSSGLVGTALVHDLREAEHEVVRLVRRRPRAVDEREWDPPAGRIDDGALDGADAVVNLCGAGIASRRRSHARKQMLLNSLVEPTQVLAAAGNVVAPPRPNEAPRPGAVELSHLRAWLST